MSVVEQAEARARALSEAVPLAVGAKRFALQADSDLLRSLAAALRAAEEERDALRRAFDAASQYVTPKDRDWILALAAASTEGAE